MPDFSTNDVNEAKRRVREMQSRAREYVNEPEIHQNDVNEVNSVLNLGDSLGSLFSSSDSALILAIILILSREGADNMLILALLYILL